MRDEFDNEVTTGDMLEGFEHDLETSSGPPCTTTAGLTSDDKAEVTRLVEQAEEAIKDARKITSGSAETE